MYGRWSKKTYCWFQWWVGGGVQRNNDLHQAWLQTCYVVLQKHVSAACNGHFVPHEHEEHEETGSVHYTQHCSPVLYLWSQLKSRTSWQIDLHSCSFSKRPYTVLSSLLNHSKYFPNNAMTIRKHMVCITPSNSSMCLWTACCIMHNLYVRQTFWNVFMCGISGYSKPLKWSWSTGQLCSFDIEWDSNALKTNSGSTDSFI